jgi:hypothetical protein
MMIDRFRRYGFRLLAFSLFVFLPLVVHAQEETLQRLKAEMLRHYTMENARGYME